MLTEFGHLVETFAAGEILKQVSWSEEAVTACWRAQTDRNDGTSLPGSELCRGACLIRPGAARVLPGTGP